jgi:hypothetical protein
VGPVRAVVVGLMDIRITETNRIQVVLCGMLNKTFGPYLALIHSIFVSFMLGGVFAVCQRVLTRGLPAYACVHPAFEPSPQLSRT